MVKRLKKRGRNLQALQQEAVAFRDARNWRQFHTPKDLTLSLLRESAELAEIFLWLTPQQTEERIRKARPEIGAELADVLSRILLMAEDFGIDLESAWEKKQKINAAKYPLSAAYGENKKYRRAVAKRR